RARMSLPPPGGNGTMKRIGFSGYLVCACSTGAVKAREAAASASAAHWIRERMLVSLWLTRAVPPACTYKRSAYHALRYTCTYKQTSRGKMMQHRSAIRHG